MPKYSPIVANEKTFAVTGIVGVSAGWQNGQDQLDSGEAFVITRRAVAAQQTTRKSTARLKVPLYSVCENTCVRTSRGDVLLDLGMTSSLQATRDERVAAYEDMLALLADEGVKQAFIDNESFWA